MNIHQRTFTYECEMLLSSSEMSYTLKNHLFFHISCIDYILSFLPVLARASSPHPSNFMFSLSKKQRAKQ